MSNRSLLFLAVVALGLCVYLYLKGGEPGTKARENEATLLSIVDIEKIDRIELTNPSGTFVFQKVGDKAWAIEKPVQFPADYGTIQTLLSELEQGRKVTVISPDKLPNPEESVRQFGLRDPRIIARFQTADEVLELRVGVKTPSGDNFYAVLRDRKKQELTVVESVIESQLAQGLELWRDPQVFKFENKSVNGLSLKRGGQEVEVVRDEAGWNITKPLSEKAVKAQVTEYLSLLGALRADKFVSENGSDPAAYGLNSPSLTLEVKLEGQSQVLRVGKAMENEPGLVFAQFGDRPAIFTVAAKNVEQAGNLLDLVRPRSPFNLSGDTVVRKIEIVQGGTSLVLSLKEGPEEVWMVEGEGMERRANTLGVQDMIQAMDTIQARNFYSSAQNPNAEYGLQKPSAVVAVAGYDPTAEGKTFERKVIFGAMKDNFVYAESSVLPFVVDVDRKFLDAFPKGVYGWFDPFLDLPKAEEITGLKWTQGENVLGIEKDAEGRWISEPAGRVVDEKFLKVHLPYLAKLKARRWVGKAVKKDFLKPRFILQVRAGDRVREIQFGPKQPDGGSLAKMAGDDFAFYLNEQDCQKVMVRPIVGEATAAGP